MSNEKKVVETVEDFCADNEPDLAYLYGLVENIDADLPQPFNAQTIEVIETRIENILVGVFNHAKIMSVKMEQ